MEIVSFAKKEHISLISEFEQKYFNSEAYSYDMLSDMLTDNYILLNNDNIFVIASETDLIGYIIFHINEDFTDIYKIFIREKDRRCGYATSLLNKVIEFSKRYNSKKIMIEVRSQNSSAINFYNKNGFNTINNRLNYYSNPKDDALILERKL